MIRIPDLEFRVAPWWFRWTVVRGAALWTATAVAWAAAPASGLQSAPLSPGTPVARAERFEHLPPSATGVDFVYRWNTAPRYERLLNSSAVGGGVAVGDYDGDGRPDVCLTRPSGGARLYRNLGACRFEEVTEAAGLREEELWTTGATFVDVNGDGRLDLYVCCYDSPNRLWMNQGDGRFVERAREMGLAFNGASMMIAFGDYDRDGHLDAYLLTAGLIPRPEQRFRVQFVDGRPVVPAELQEYWQIFYLPGERAASAEAGQFDHLFHNNGDGTFTDVSAAAGIRGCDFGNAVLWWDYDADGWPDLYVANDYFGPDRLYRNRGNGTFSEVSRETLPHTPWTSMGADAADLNGDGWIDLVASDMSGTTHYQRMIDMIDHEKSGWFLEYPEPRQYLRNAVFLNSGRGRFLEVAQLAGLADTDWTWSIVLGDLDQDGAVDVFVPNGMTRNWMDVDRALQAKALPPAEFTRFWRAQPVRADRNLAFRNLGDLRFESCAVRWGLDRTGPSFGAALADLDDDGDLDLVVNDFEAPARIHRNDLGSAAHRVQVQLRSATPNRFALGATIRVESGGRTQIRYLTTTRGFMSAGEPAVHFGLGAETRIQRLTVDWPRGQQSVFEDLPADRRYTLTEPGATERVTGVTNPSAGWFRESGASAAWTHESTTADDFASQPLLPWSLSRYGPGMAWGDVNRDGRADVYLSGSSSHPGRLFLAEGSGFRAAPEAVPGSGVEEMAPLFLDANADGTPDLFIVTGGAGVAPGAPELRDRLLLNDGTGRFVPAPPEAVPDLRDSGSTAVAADFDRDGDLDLFVGSRWIPGQYPRVPPSHLLRNDGGRFVEVTAQLAPGLQQPGLVTGALWSDADGDGWIDLLVACEWGPVRWFRNEAGRLVERTEAAGLSAWTGWWNGISGGDVDNDGDIDYLVTNLGLNSRHQPTSERPSRLYAIETGDGGAPGLLEARVTPEGLLPLRGRSALARAIPGLAERFPTYHDYARATLPQLVGDDVLARATMLEVNTAESGVLMNQGTGRFAFRPLPRLAQVAPAFGGVLAPLNNDAWLDAAIVQNHFGMHRESGRLDGGIGWVFAGRGDGVLDPVWPDHSGLVVSGEGRSLTLVDVNADGALDLAVGRHGDRVQLFENMVGGAPGRLIRVLLEGGLGNPTAVGARVQRLDDPAGQPCAEVYAGGGFLAQSAPGLCFNLGPRTPPVRLRVRWPRGASTEHIVPAGTAEVRLREP